MLVYGCNFIILDIQECDFSPCDVNANCTELPGSYRCNCRAGYAGNGTVCRGTNIMRNDEEKFE